MVATNIPTEGLRYARKQAESVLAALLVDGELSVSAVVNPGCVFRVPVTVAKQAIEDRIAMIDAELTKRGVV